jgi:predicted dinucleotide-binding enzyme
VPGTAKIVIVGTGHVGVTVARAGLIRGTGKIIVGRSSRLRSLITQRCGVAVQSVHACRRTGHRR